ncbi:MAG: ExbD/TolR family protein [Bdellovibrionales bacterium]
MAIFKPGQRFRYHNILKRRGRSRSVTATLSLTAMVDMFTVLVIFLLQAYSSNPVVLINPENVSLPQAEQTKELKPAAVITVSKDNVFIEKMLVATMEEVRASQDWILPRMRDELVKLLQQKKLEYDNQLRNRVQTIIGAQEAASMNNQEWRKVTIQADKDVNYLAVKKVMYTLTASGAGEINFAVMKKDDASAAD